MTLKLISPPGVEPISLGDIKAQCRVDGDAEDSLLALAIAAARAHCEGLLDRALITQTWEQVLDAFPVAEISLGRPAVQSISSIKYTDTSGNEQIVPTSAYSLDADNMPGWVLPAVDTSWPETASVANAVRVRFVSGYGPAGADVPADIRAWVMLTAAYFYGQREAMDLSGRVSALPNRFVDGLLDPYRVYVR